MGNPVRASFPLATEAPALAVPRNPCSGEKRRQTSTSRARRLSTRGRWSVPITPVWLLTSPTRLPRSRGSSWSSRSAPTCIEVEGGVGAAKSLGAPTKRTPKTKVITLSKNLWARLLIFCIGNTLLVGNEGGQAIVRKGVLEQSLDGTQGASSYICTHF